MRADPQTRGAAHEALGSRSSRIKELRARRAAIGVAKSHAEIVDLAHIDAELTSLIHGLGLLAWVAK